MATEGHDVTADETAIPPLYGQHIMDAPVDPFSGIVSVAATPRARSGAATPHGGVGQQQQGPPTAAELSSLLATLSAEQADASTSDDRNWSGVEHIHLSEYASTPTSES